MASNPFRKLGTGDRPTHEAWNAFLGLLPPHNRPHVTSQRNGRSARGGYAGSVILVKNAYTDIGQFGVLGITGATVVNPATSDATLSQFKMQPRVEGDLPTLDDHFGRFVVAIEPIISGNTGRAVASGIVIVKIDVLDADHRYADVKDADAAKLQSKPIGAARILWKESGTGTKWAIVNIGVLPPCLFPVQVDQTGGSAGDASTQCSFTYTVRDLAGYQLGTGMTPLKRRPAAGEMSAVDPSFGYGTGFYDYSGTFYLWDANEVFATAGPC